MTAHPTLDQAREILRERFGHGDFRPGQEEVIGALLDQGSALAVFPTGSGKSLCYQLPALLFEGVTVVVSPLIALMKDQIDDLTSLGIAAARLDSSLSLEETRSVARSLRDGSLKILYVAPERFTNERFLEQIERARVALFAVDEAHCISEWGHNFRPDYLKLAETAREVGAERVLALTATATPAVVADVCRSFRIPGEAAVVTGFHRPNLHLYAAPTRAADRDRVLVERLRSRPPGSGIVYVTLQATAERVAERLREAGLEARAYHAGMDAEARDRVQEWWRDSGRATVVATIAFGMGIDKADVRYVYHYNLPKSLEGYSQEIGRAGRDGAPSIVEVLGSAEDLVVLENFAYGDTPTEEALGGLLADVLGRGEEFDVSLYELSSEHDVRPLVLRTALTYLELMGVLRQGTPFYATYRVKPLLPIEEITGRFDPARARFLEGIFREAKQGRTWYTVDSTAVAEVLGEPRDRIVSALGYLGEQGWAEIQPTEARQRYARLVDTPDLAALGRKMAERFARRERQEMGRLQGVVELLGGQGCITHRLLAYFGEERSGGCGHCGWCEGQGAASLPRAEPVPIRVDRAAVRALADAHPAALAHPRQRARLLCGLSSPRLTREKLTRNPLYGKLEGQPFGEVLAWCAAE